MYIIILLIKLKSDKICQYNLNQKTTIAFSTFSTFNFLYERGLELVRIVAN